MIPPKNGLVLSIYPGIDLQGRAMEELGFCVVRGPDPLWGGDIRTFHPPAGIFEGVIGGPPCQHWTRLMFLNPKSGDGMEWVVNEYARVVHEAQPDWFLMEEVPFAPMPLVAGYHIFDVLLRDEEVGGIQPRERRFSFGTPDGRMLYVLYHEPKGNDSGKEKRSILSSGTGSHGGGRGEGWEGGRLPGAKKSITTDGRTGSGSIRPRHLEMKAGGNLPHEGQVADIADACEAMGLPRNFTEHMPFTMQGKRAIIGNGVPMPMGRAVAQAIKRAMVDG